LTEAASGQLMDDARQRMARVWRGASAAQLDRRARIGFAATLAAIILIVLLSGVLFRPYLVPFVALLLMAPGVLRIAAAFPTRVHPEPPSLPDTDLPV